MSEISPHNVRAQASQTPLEAASVSPAPRSFGQRLFARPGNIAITVGLFLCPLIAGIGVITDFLG